ncbi:MAG: hypothetical protein AB8G26_12595 [Ilumatobacter sp.]
MSDIAESTGPLAHARIVYLGPVSPHWEVYGDWGDRQTLDEFRARVLARLVLLPREDPQFRRNRERIVRDAEREQISIEWDLGVVAQQTATESAAAEGEAVDAEGDTAAAGHVASDAASAPEATESTDDADPTPADTD